MQIGYQISAYFNRLNIYNLIPTQNILDKDIETQNKSEFLNLKSERLQTPSTIRINFNDRIFTLHKSEVSFVLSKIIVRLRNHNATDAGSVDFGSLKNIQSLERKYRIADLSVQSC